MYPLNPQAARATQAYKGYHSSTAFRILRWTLALHYNEIPICALICDELLHAQIWARVTLHEAEGAFDQRIAKTNWQFPWDTSFGLSPPYWAHDHHLYKELWQSNKDPIEVGSSSTLERCGDSRTESVVRCD